MEQLVQGFPPHIRALQAPPATLLPLTSGAFLAGLVTGGQNWKEKRERKKRGKRIKPGGPFK